MSLLRSTFERLKGATAGAALALAAFGGAAQAQDARVIPVEAAAPITILQDAHRPADEWVVGHPDRIAVSVVLGAESQTPPENIEIILRRDFAAVGISNVEFFFESGAPHGTVVAYHTDEYVYGPFGLDTARDEVAKTASQIQFNRQVAQALTQ